MTHPKHTFDRARAHLATLNAIDDPDPPTNEPLDLTPQARARRLADRARQRGTGGNDAA